MEVSHQMRLLSRLLIKVRELCGAPAVSLQTIFSPEYFDDLIASARSLRGIVMTRQVQWVVLKPLRPLQNADIR